MVNVNQKGKRVEREFAAWERAHGVPSARRTQQFSGDNGDDDVIALELPSFFQEVKGRQSKLFPRSIVKSWFDRIDEVCPKNKIPVVFCLVNNQNWISIIEAKTATALCGGIHAIGSVCPFDSIDPFPDLERQIICNTWLGVGEFYHPAFNLFKVDDKRIVAFADGLDILKCMLRYEKSKLNYPPIPTTEIEH